MSIRKRMATGWLAVLALGIAYEAAERAGIPGVAGVVTPAKAVVGRPLTPVSYAGVARRTSRRCAGGYYC